MKDTKTDLMQDKQTPPAVGNTGGSSKGGKSGTLVPDLIINHENDQINKASFKLKPKS